MNEIRLPLLKNLARHRTEKDTLQRHKVGIHTKQAIYIIHTSLPLSTFIKKTG